MIKVENFSKTYSFSFQLGQALGKTSYGPTEKEKKSLIFRRSLYIVQDMRKGDILTKENLRAIRPGLGMHPKYYDTLLGKCLNRNAKRGTAFSWEMVLG